MEMKKRPPQMAKKLWNMVSIVLYMMRRSRAKSKMMVHLLKKSKNAISNLILHHHHHYAALTCRSADANAAFISPREVEFSCSNTPLYPSHHRKNHHHHHYHAEDLKLMQKVFTILSRYDVVETAAAAPPPLPGFGRSPIAARQLRVTDSPFAAAGKEYDDRDHLKVDEDAEEFIKKFYIELKKQRPTALESPLPNYHEWATYLR